MNPYLPNSVIIDFKEINNFLPEINLTTRKAGKYDNLSIGDSLYIRKVGDTDTTLRGTVLSVVTAPLWYANEIIYKDTVGENPTETPVLQYAFNPANRTLEGMLAAMKRAYGEAFTEHDNTTFVLFQIDPVLHTCPGCGGIKSFGYRAGGERGEFYCYTCNAKLPC